MLRLALPEYDYKQVIDLCVEGITGNNALRNNLSAAKEILLQGATNYESLARVGDLFTLSPVSSSVNESEAVVVDLTTTNFKTLYEYYFTESNKPARKVYENILASANEKCPYCGGIGRPRNLDHYLPKAHFPQFSVLPFNLVPSCRDCNMDGKKSIFAISKGDQVLHPYLDKDCYFKEQWLKARYISDNDEGVVEYFVEPPGYWQEDHKQRVIKHFTEFDLKKRYSIEGSSRAATIIKQINSVMQLVSDLSEAKEIIIKPIIDDAPSVNHWERVMCLALMEDFVG